MTEKQTVLLKIVLIAMVAGIVQQVLPWWSIAIAAFVVEQLGGKNRPTYSFYAGFYGIAVVWIPYMFYVDHKNSHILSHRICKLFSLPEYPILLMLLAAIIGGSVAGLAALSGNYFKSFFTKNEAA